MQRGVFSIETLGYIWYTVPIKEGDKYMMKRMKTVINLILMLVLILSFTSVVFAETGDNAVQPDIQEEEQVQPEQRLRLRLFC